MTAHVERAIERYFEGRPSEMAERDALFGHLDRCDSCRRRFDELANVHRALSGRLAGDELPETELALIGASVIDAASKGPARVKWWSFARISPVLAPLAAAVVAAIIFIPRGEFASKGGGTPLATGTIEVLCFDEKAEVRAHLATDGACPAPGFVKLLFASPVSVPVLSVAIFAGDEVRLSAKLVKPEPRTVLFDHAKLAPGEVLRVIAVNGEEELSAERAKQLHPVITVLGVAQ